MRAIVQLNDYDPDELFDDDDEPHDPHKDPRSVVHGIDTEWYEGSGNIHIVDENVDQVAELISGAVIVTTPETHQQIDRAELVTVYNE